MAPSFTTPLGHELVVAGAGVALFAAFRLSQRSRRATGVLRWVWVLFAGLGAGAGAWTAHVASVLAHTAQSADGYAPGLILGALGLAAAGCLVAFAAAAWRADLEARAAAGLVFGVTSWGALTLVQLSVYMPQPHALQSSSAALSLALMVAAGVGACCLSGARKDAWRAGGAAAVGALGLLFGADLLNAGFVPVEGVAAARPTHALQAAHVAALAALLCVFLLLGGGGVAIVHARGKNASLDRLRTAIEAMPAGLGFYDAEDRLQVWNTRMVEVMSAPCRAAVAKGVAFEDLIRRDLESGSYPDAAGREEAWLEERLALRRAGQGAQVQALEDGRWLRVEDRRTPDGGLVTICVDVTDVKRQEESFRLLFAANPAPMWLWDPTTLKFLDMNDAAHEAYGVARDEVAELTVLDFLDAEERAALLELAKRKTKTYRGERVWRHLTRRGEVLHVLPYVQLSTFEGRPALLAAMVDVSDRVRVEEELQRHTKALEEARDEAETANRAKSAFLANMSHEIRTPLNGVVAVADVLARTDLSPEQRDMVELVRNSGVTLERLLSDVLDLARVESGRFELEHEPFDLHRALKDVATLAELKASEKNVPVRLIVAEDAPETVRGDVTRFKQILTNLLSNAVKFTVEGEVALIVRRETDGATRFEVRDTGAGFDGAQKERIFARFQQADGSITRKFGGTGLGLAISRELATLMGGSLDCESSPGVGSVFTVVLPLERAEIAAVETGAAETSAAATADMADDGAPVRVLLADDHPTNRKVVELILLPLGVEMVSVEDGEAALAACREGVFDVVLMDMQMPGMDGLSATRAIRALEAAEGRPRTPVVMLTANAMPEHVAASHEAGADRHLAKPIRADALIATIEECVAGQASVDMSSQKGRAAA